MGARIDAAPEKAAGFVSPLSGLLERDLGIRAEAVRFSFPATRYLSIQSREPLGRISRYRPFPSKSLRGFSNGLAALFR